MNKPLCDQDMWKDIWVCLQKYKVILNVFHVLTHKALILLRNQEANALARVQTLDLTLQ